jgi:hypothetical protein
MTLARISNHGLAAIALSVASLWGFVIAEHLERRDALAQRARIMQEQRLMERRGSPVPATAPHLPLPRRLHTAAG